MQYLNYLERRTRGTTDFPVDYHHVTSNHPQYHMALHWHMEYEIIRILKNTFRLTLDETTYEVSEGSVVFVPSGLLHEGTPSDCVYECIVFDMNMLISRNDSFKQLIKSIHNHDLDLRHVFDSSYKDIHNIIWTMFDAVASKNPGYQMIVEGSLYLFFGTIFSKQYFSPVQNKGLHSQKRILQLKVALEYIESSYQNSITLKEIADTVHMSPKYFCRFFQDMTKRTPIDYLNYYRVERACYKILTTDDSITDIAYNSGFNDLSYFIKTFKKYKGVTPKQYLK
ncbi:AraC-like DNA-binding protein [Aequitasia blattaphilus]|uniref:AraC family transcriptional regulator n=1 Tax=Aequitasia blattaphilus TaxID=2949332 RepID=A0ABT1E7V4_9FIRM|nr:AraC family transcriptional regulator [Aequitasia blattaphilus]MCP1101899.1 AraC family transcriptional regulator [Aequitasia blattaphilus]MCR8614539.1 AraC family transcriptional regulator [Aequitasia blattaphilus]